jgi:glyoxylase-like metal-dependent hydrolase (beta-lactamase superfamily II)
MAMHQSEHFSSTQLGKGIYAAIQKEGGWAISNAGFVDLGDTLLVFDTFLTPQAASDLKGVAESISSHQVEIVVNSHYHNDHIWGNMAFSAGADIISSEKTRQMILTQGKKEYDWYRDNSADQLAAVSEKYEGEKDPEKAQAIKFWIPYYEGLVETMPTLQLYLPNITFQQELMIYGKDRTAVLIAYPQAHTAGDTILYLPDEGILFASDLLFVGCHPYLAEGNVEQWLLTLNAFLKLQATVYVPGHGPVGSRQDLELMIDYIHHCEQTAQTLLAESDGQDEISEIPVPEKFAGWDLPMFFQENIRALVKSKQ